MVYESAVFLSSYMYLNKLQKVHIYVFRYVKFFFLIDDRKTSLRPLTQDNVGLLARRPFDHGVGLNKVSRPFPSRDGLWQCLSIHKQPHSKPTSRSSRLFDSANSFKFCLPRQSVWNDAYSCSYWVHWSRILSSSATVSWTVGQCQRSKGWSDCLCIGKINLPRT